MRFTYDPEADSLLLTLGDADEQADTWTEPVDGVVMDFDGDKNPISLEIQRASRRYPKSTLLSINVQQPVSFSQLANEYGLTEAHLRKLAITGRLAASKIGRNWTATRAALEDYLDSRKYNAKDVISTRALVDANRAT